LNLQRYAWHHDAHPSGAAPLACAAAVMPRRPLRMLLSPKGAAATAPDWLRDGQTCSAGRAPNTVGVLAQTAVRSDRLVAVAEPVHAQNFRL